MKIIYLNVAVGCKEPERYRRLVDFVTSQKPDFLGLSELNGWDKDDFAKLSAFKVKTGMKFSIFCRSPHGYHMALFSRTGFESKRVLQSGLWHGAIIADASFKGKTYRFALTHLSPLSEEMRIKDIGRILEALRQRRSFLMGDMNSISPQDIIDDSALLRKAKKLRIRKFGKDRIEKEVIALVLKKGLIDLTHHFGRPAVYSVPTRFVHDPNHFARLHLDYIFITRDLRKKVERAGVLRNKETDSISDHYPVVAQMRS